MSFVRRRITRTTVWIAAAILCLSGAGFSVHAIVTDMRDTRVSHAPVAVHADQDELLALVKAGQNHEAFEEAFELGDELFATEFNALDGVGANVGTGQRFSRVPRADLKGAGEWFTHRPVRVTGPNGSGCFQCHNSPFEDGSGNTTAQVHRDTFRTGLVGQFVERNTPHVFAQGAIQRLGEEMTDDLFRIQTRLERDTCQMGGTRTAVLLTKGVTYGTLSATRQSASPCRVTFNTDGIRGIDFQPSVDNPDAPPELIVRGFQWKGSVAFLRDFIRGASHNELGMQAVEVTGDDVDGDFDGVRNEMTIGDQTALSIYLAAQPRPTTLLELQALGQIDPLPATRISAINRGRAVFSAVGCAVCHIPTLVINNPIFSEPSQNAAFRDGVAFPAGQSTVGRGVDPRFPVVFDLTRDQPDNILRDGNGEVFFHLGAFRRTSNGGAIVEMFGDMKRHDMGPRLADSVNEIAGDDVTPIPLNPRNRHTPSTFMTENLWGVGSTGPYMHDGRATTLTEAILEHGSSNPQGDTSEAAASRRAFLSRSDADKRALIAFLENLVLFKIAEDEQGEAIVSIAPKDVNVRLPRGNARIRSAPPLTTESEAPVPEVQKGRGTDELR